MLKLPKQYRMACLNTFTKHSIAQIVKKIVRRLNCKILQFLNCKNCLKFENCMHRATSGNTQEKQPQKEKKQ